MIYIFIIISNALSAWKIRALNSNHLFVKKVATLPLIFVLSQFSAFWRTNRIMSGQYLVYVYSFFMRRKDACVLVLCEIIFSDILLIVVDSHSLSLYFVFQWNGIRLAVALRNFSCVQWVSVLLIHFVMSWCILLPFENHL